jgi:succinate dehydrogenase / fumarate reductase cytochrome b subunit
METTSTVIPKAFIWRRIHSLMGLWLVLFLIEHLLTNSQAALWIGDSGRGFVNMVNSIHNLPYREVVELTLIGIPFLIHGLWGIKYLLSAKFNSLRNPGNAPYLPLGRNRAYTWQRITSWFLLFAVAFHVIKFRFIEYPDQVNVGSDTFYISKVTMDNGLYTLADRLKVRIYDSAQIAIEKKELEERNSERALLGNAERMREEQMNTWTGPVPQDYSNQKMMVLDLAQEYQGRVDFVQALDKETLKSGEVLVVAQEFGTASLLVVRDTFKNPLYVGFYTLFVLAACFHAANGFWTFLITWGWVLKMAAQRAWVGVSIVIMAVLIFLGLAAAWGTYWINLRY